MTWKIPDPKESALIALLAFVGAAVSAKDALTPFMSSPIAIAILAIVAMVVILSHAVSQRTLTRLTSPLPKSPNIFNPFAKPDQNGNVNLWARPNEVDHLSALISSSESSHIIVTGPSGAGKSTIVKFMLPDAMVNRGFVTTLFSSYGNFIIDFIEDNSPSSSQIIKQRHLISEYKQFIANNKCHVRDVFDPAHRPPDEFYRLCNSIESYFDSTIKQLDNRLYVFDQSERLIHIIKSTSHDIDHTINGYDVYFFILILRYLRKMPNCRTAFVIRSEYLYQSFDFIENAMSAIEHKPDGLKDYTPLHIRHFLCPGINTISSDEAVNGLRRDFKKIPHASAYANTFERMNEIDSRTFSNTFITQLSGYMIEHFLNADHSIRHHLSHNSPNRSFFVTKFFEYLVNHAYRHNPTKENTDILKIVLFAIAVENRLIGQPIDVDRLSALCHLPLSQAERVTALLQEVGVVQNDPSDGIPRMRMAHDILSDHVLENDQLSPPPILKDAIRGLSEGRVATANLTRVSRFANPINDLIESPNVGLFFVLMFYAFGTTKCLAPQFCEILYPYLRTVPFSRSCEFMSPIYYPIFAMHCIWLTFIYILDRDYFSRTLHSKTLRTLSCLMPIIGSLLGIIFSQSPTLSLLPITSIGLLMGFILISGGFDGSFSGHLSADNRRWGIRTIGNMLFTCVLILLTSVIFWDQDVAVAFWNDVSAYINQVTGSIFVLTHRAIQISWIWFVGSAMIYFWWHIKSEQQDHVSSAARLAIFDRARMEAKRI